MPDKTQNFWLAVVKQWWKDDCLVWGAALAFHSVLALAPLLFTLVFVAGLFLDEAETRGQIAAAISRDFGSEVAAVARVVMDSMSGAPKSQWTAWLAFGLAVVGASSLFGLLRKTLNHIWEVKLADSTTWRDTLIGRLLAIAMLALVAAIVLASFILSALTATVGRLANETFPLAGPVVPVLEFAASFAVIALAVACIFKWLPDVKIHWRVALAGGAATALLFTVGKLAVGFYIRTADVGSAYGAAGSIIVALVWMYYTAQAFFLGAEFTQVWATRSGYRIVPDANAQWELCRVE